MDEHHQTQKKKKEKNYKDSKKARPAFINESLKKVPNWKTPGNEGIH